MRSDEFNAMRDYFSTDFTIISFNSCLRQTVARSFSDIASDEPFTRGKECLGQWQGKTTWTSSRSSTSESATRPSPQSQEPESKGQAGGHLALEGYYQEAKGNERRSSRYEGDGFQLFRAWKL